MASRYTHAQNVAEIRSAMSSGRLQSGGPRSLPPEQLSARQAARYAGALRADPTATDLTLRDLRGHALTPEHPTQAVKITAAAHRREQYVAGNARTGRAPTREQVLDAARRVRSTTIHVAIHGKKAVGSDPRSGRYEMGWISASTFRSELVRDIQDGVPFEEIADQLADVEGIMLDVDQISIGRAPQ